MRQPDQPWGQGGQSRVKARQSRGSNRPFKQPNPPIQGPSRSVKGSNQSVRGSSQARPSRGQAMVSSCGSIFLHITPKFARQSVVRIKSHDRFHTRIRRLGILFHDYRRPTVPAVIIQATNTISMRVARHKPIAQLRLMSLIESKRGIFSRLERCTRTAVFVTNTAEWSARAKSTDQSIPLSGRRLQASCYLCTGCIATKTLVCFQDTLNSDVAIKRNTSTRTFEEDPTFRRTIYIYTSIGREIRYDIPGTRYLVPTYRNFQYDTSYASDTRAQTPHERLRNQAGFTSYREGSSRCSTSKPQYFLGCEVYQQQREKRKTEEAVGAWGLATIITVSSENTEPCESLNTQTL